MGDPLSVTASAASFLALGLQSAEYLYNFYIRYRAQHEELARTAQKLGILVESLQNIDNLVRTHKWRPDERSSVQTLEKSISGCEDIIKFLQDEVNKFKAEPTDNWKAKIVVGGRKAAYPFKRSTLEDLGDEINDFRDNLLIALHAIQLKEHENTQSDIENTTACLKAMQAQLVSKSITTWLNSPDPTIDLNIISSKRHTNTGNWFVKGPAYTNWLTQDNSFLWLYGFAGCGKSVLCSTAIHDARERRGVSAESAVAFTDKAKQDVSAALKSILLQLCGQVLGLENKLARLKESTNQGTPALPELLKVIRQAVTQCRHVYILLDALDECPAGDSRLELLTVIKTMRQWHLPNLHLLITSRNEQDIRDHLKWDNLSHDREHIELKNDGVEQDIAQYVSSQLENDPQLKRWGEHREKIKTYLGRHANGVFRWAACQLEPLRQYPKSEYFLNKCLRSLPKTLQETYERIVSQSCSPEDARQLLSLLCFARRPLSVEEVIAALAVDVDGLGGYDPARRLGDEADDLARICPGLIEFGSEETSQWSESRLGRRIVRIAHYSVQEYVLCSFAPTESSQHGRLSKLCLLYLQNPALQDRDFVYSHRNSLIGPYAFANYAANHWYKHHQQADDRSAQELVGLVVTLLTTDNLRKSWEHVGRHVIWNGRASFPQPKGFGTCQGSRAVYYASLFGLSFALAEMLATPVAKFHGPKCDCTSPLQGALSAASGKGFKTIVKMLLDNGASVNEERGLDGVPLHQALSHGDIEIAQLLLENGADINATHPVSGRTALIVMSSYGDVKFVKFLIQNGANVNFVSTEPLRNNTALVEASTYGHVEVVQLLIQSGADINIIDTRGKRHGTALMEALDRYHDEVVHTLLDHGADINLMGRYGETVWEVAAVLGHTPLVRRLLDMTIKNDTGWDSLCPATCAAFLYCRPTVVELLFQHVEHINLPELVQSVLHYWRDEKWQNEIRRPPREGQPIVSLPEEWCMKIVQMAYSGGHEGVLDMMHEQMSHALEPYEMLDQIVREWDAEQSPSILESDDTVLMRFLGTCN